MSPSVQKKFSFLAATVVLVTGSTLAARAEQRAHPTDGSSVVVPLRASANKPETYGLTDRTAYTIPAWAFQSNDGSPLANNAPNYYSRYSPTAREVEAPVFVPEGALITSIELQGCDNDAAGQVVYILVSVDSNGNYTALSSLGSTGLAATPGCGFFSLDLSTPAQVDNFNLTYYVAVLAGNNQLTGYTAMRVYYNLQVSPAPLTATFNDVPTDDFGFQFVEAFADAGITVGCTSNPPFTPPVYCPDRNVTRREMAIFFAKALGLHFAP